MSKNQFQSTESLKIRLPPFLDKTTGDHIIGGADTVTLTIERPDTTLLPGGPHTATYDATVDMWVFTILVASYQQGEWRVKAVSNDVNAIPMWRYYQWGDYVDDITTGKTAAQSADTKLGTPVGASISADIAAVQTAASNAETAAAAAQSSSAAAAADASQVRKVEVNRWKVQGTQLLIYEDNGTTVFKAFDLKDDAGAPSATRIFERVPV